MESQWKLSALGLKNREQGKPSFELEMYKGVLVDETAMVSSPVEVTKIFDGTFVKRFNRRKEANTYDPAEVEAWKGELKYITPGQYAQSECTADQMRKETPNRVKSPHASKFAREVNRIHHDDSRNPVDVFALYLAKAISYKGDVMSLFKGTIQMHYGSAVGATD
jgi:hypothetical protein